MRLDEDLNIIRNGLPVFGSHFAIGPTAIPLNANGGGLYSGHDARTFTTSYFEGST
jgi:hypothetical protein